MAAVSHDVKTLRSWVMEYFRSLETILTILLGWLLGLFTSAIAETIRRPYRRRDLMSAVVDEMIGLQYTMAAFAHAVRTRNSEVTDDFLDKIIPIIDGYMGPDRLETLAPSLRKTRSIDESQRAAVHRAMQKPNVGMSMREYAIPLFAAQLQDLVICSLEFQRAVLRIRYNLDLFNQLVPYVQSLYEMTFKGLSESDRQAVITNQEQTYRQAGARAEIIIDAIFDLNERYGSRAKKVPQ